MNLNELRDEAYSIAKANGWHEEEHSDSHWLMLIITEIAEAVQADRKDKHADAASFNEYQTYYGSFLPSEETREIRFKEDFEAYIKNTVEDELADVMIRCLDLAGLRGFDLRGAVKLTEGLESIKEGITFIDFCYALSGVSACDDSTEGKIIAVIAVVLGYCKLTGIDLDFFIRTKMKYNRLRGYWHGGKKYISP